MQGKLKGLLGATLLLCILLLCALPIYKRYTAVARAAHFSILDSDTVCGNTSNRTSEIELLASATAGRAIVKLNGNNRGWDDISPRLRDLYSAGRDKYVYVRVEPGVSDSDLSALDYLLESAGTERSCHLDFKAPHKYVRDWARLTIRP